MTQLSLDEVLGFISAVKDPELLVHINQELNTRYFILRDDEALQLKKRLIPGQSRVKVREGTQPNYMASRMGIVTAVHNSKATVDFGIPVRRYGQLVKMPLTSLILMED